MNKVKNSFITEYLCGSPIIGMDQFYEVIDELKELKQNIPYYLYSANLVDQYRFEFDANDWPIIKIKNKTKDNFVTFDINSYLIAVYNFQSSLSLNDVEISIKDNKKVLQIILTDKLKKEIEIVRENINYDYKSVLDLILDDVNSYLCKLIDYVNSLIDDNLSDNEILDNLQSGKFITTVSTDKEYINSKELCDWITEGILKDSGNAFLFSDNLPQIDFNDYKNKRVKTVIEKWKISSWEKFLKSIIKKYKESLKICQSNIINISKFPVNTKVLSEFSVWDIIGNKFFKDFLSKSETLDLKVKYIGQAFGKKGSRTVFERIGDGHSHIQRILAEKPDDKDVVLLFFGLRPQGSVLGRVGEDTEKLKQFLINITNDVYKKIGYNEHINLAEMALIMFFRPSENVDFVNQVFEKLSYPSIKEICENFDGIVIELDCGNYNLTISSDRRHGNDKFISSKRFIETTFENKDFSLYKEIKKYYKDVK